METKVCTCCGFIKPLESFYANKNQCKVCYGNKVKERYTNQKDRVLLGVKESIRNRIEKSNWTIYIISVPEIGVYVGSTQCFDLRISKHISQINTGKHYVKLFNMFDPEKLDYIKICEYPKTSTKDEIRKVEEDMIEMFQKLGLIVFNSIKAHK